MRLIIRIIAMVAIVTGLFNPNAYSSERLTTLRARFDDALARLDEGYKTLNDAYVNALLRLMDSESSLGRLENALGVKAEIEAFKAEVVFDRAVFERRLSQIDALKRIQNTYLTQRNALGRDLEPRRKDLVVRFDQELAKLQIELTKIGQLNAALNAKRAQEELRADPRFSAFFADSGAPKNAIQGKVRFVTKGELELFLNGKSLSYRDDYKGPDSESRITGETKGSEVFHSGDLLVIRARSSASYRGIIAAIVDDNNRSCIPIRVEHLRYLGVDKDPKSLVLEDIKAIAVGGVSQGGNDDYMTPEWDKVKPPFPEGGGSQWFRSETNNEWHCWGVIITPEMIVSPDAK